MRSPGAAQHRGSERVSNSAATGSNLGTSKIFRQWTFQAWRQYKKNELPLQPRTSLTASGVSCFYCTPTDFVSKWTVGQTIFDEMSFGQMSRIRDKQTNTSVHTHCNVCLQTTRLKGTKLS